LAENPFDVFDTEDAVIAPAQSSGVNPFDAYDTEPDAQTAPTFAPVEKPAEQPFSFQPTPGVSFQDDPEINGLLSELSDRNKQDSKAALDKARGDGFLDGISDPQQYLEVAKGVVPGGIRFAGTTAKGAAAIQSAPSLGYDKMLRAKLETFDRIDAGDRVRDMRDTVGTFYQNSSLADRAVQRAELERQIAEFNPTPVQDRALFKAGESVTEFSKGVLPAAPGYEDAVGRQLGEGLGSLVAGLPMGFLGRVPAAVFFGAGGSGEAVDRALEFDRQQRAAGHAGLTQEQIVTSALWGVAPGTTDLLPVEVLLGRLKIPAPFTKTFAKVIGRIGGQAFVEGTQEGGQAFMQNLIAQEMYNPEQGLTEGIVPEAGLGAGVGGVASTAKEVAELALKSFAGRRARIRAANEPFPGDEIESGSLSDLVQQIDAANPAAAVAEQPAKFTPRVQRPTDSQGVDVVQFIRNNGGIKPSGELSAVNAERYPGLVREGGVNADMMRERLVEAGYLEETGPDQPAVTTPQDVYDLIGRSIAGERIVPVAEQAGLRSRNEQQTSYEFDRELQGAEENFVLPEIAKIDQEIGGAVIGTSYARLTNDEKAEVIERHWRGGEDVADVIEEIAVRSDDAPSIAALAIRRVAEPEQMGRVRQVVAERVPELLADFDGLVSNLGLGGTSVAEAATALLAGDQLGSLDVDPDAAAGAVTPLADAAMQPIQPEPTAPTDFRQSFATLLDSKAPLSKAAEALGVSEEDLAPLVEEAVQKGWLRRDAAGKVRRAPKTARTGNIAALAVADVAPDGVPGEGNVVKTDAAEARTDAIKAAIHRAAAKILPADVSIDVVDNIAIARLRREDEMLALREQTAFARWFGDSKVVDENGEPLVVYHGSKDDFDQFDPKMFGASDDGLVGKGYYFTYNPEEASGYALNETFGRGSGSGPNVLPVYVSLKNPFVITHGVLPDGRNIRDVHAGPINSKGGAEVRKLAEAAGHDGIIFASREGEVRHVIAWEPTQIKSAIGNRGTFDPADPRMSYALRPRREQTESEKSAMLGAEQDGVSDDRSAEDRAAIGGEGVEAGEGQPGAGIPAGAGESMSAAGVEGRDARILRIESGTFRPDGSIIAGRLSRTPGRDVPGASDAGQVQQVGDTQEFSIGGFSGRVTGEEVLSERQLLDAGIPLHRLRLAKLTYRVYADNADVPVGKRIAFKKIAAPLLAQAKITQHMDGTWEVSMVEVNPTNKRKGLASQLYAAIEADLGIRMSPSGVLTEDGYKFWLRRSPASVQWHEWSPVDQTYISPNWIDTRIDDLKDEVTKIQRKAIITPLDDIDLRSARSELQRLIGLWKELPEEARAAKDQMFALRAYHGSPHDFDRFDLSRIGTGEGAQAFGRGLYFAEKPDVAKSYLAIAKDRVPPYNDIVAREFPEISALSDGIAEKLFMKSIHTTGTPREAAALVQSNTPELAQIPRDRLASAIKRLRNAREGRLYEVEIDVEPYQLLDWDKPIKEQSPEVKAALAKIPWAEAYLNTSFNGSRIAPHTDEGMRQLREAGIPGIRFLDQGSRGAGEGSRNIVIFDDSLVRITHKDGTPVSAAERAEVVDEMFALGRGQTPQILTPEFRKWFGDSKVVDENGRPLVVYHGTGSDIESFNASGGTGKTFETGAFFSDSPAVANTYASGTSPTVVPVHLSLKNPVVIDAGGANWARIGQKAKILLPETEISTKEDDDLLAELGVEAASSGTKKLKAKNTTLKAIFGRELYNDDTLSTDDLARWARKQGYESVIIKNVIDRGPSGAMHTDAASVPSTLYVAFEPTQIKSAIGNRGTFDPTDPRINNAMRRQSQQPEALGRTDPYNMQISIAMRAIEAEAAAKGKAPVEEAIRVLRHEAVEFFKAMGLFQPKEWQLLERTARQKGWIETTGVRQAYTELYGDAYNASTDQELALRRWFKKDTGRAPHLPRSKHEVKVYHGTKGVFEKFETSKSTWGDAIHLTDSPSAANTYTGIPTDSGWMQPNVIPAFIDTRNFKKVVLKGYEVLNDDAERLLKERELARSEGYSGVVISGATDNGVPGNQYITWTKGTVRSAISDNQLFSLRTDGQTGPAPISTSPELEQLLIKEAIAEQYSEFHLGRKQFSPAITKIFQRLKTYLTRIMNWMKGQGFQTWEDVFTRIDEGEFKARFEKAFGGDAQARQGGVAPMAVPGMATNAPLSPAPPVATRGTAPSAPGSLIDIQRELRRRLGLTVAKGRLDPATARAVAAGGGKLMGQFDRQTEVIRLRVLQDIDTEAHEVAHALENRYPLAALQSVHATELTGVASLTGQTGLSEGFAEFFRLYMTNPQAAQAHAPVFYREFEDFLDVEDAQTLTDIQDIRDQYAQWRNASSAGRITAAVKSGVPTSTWQDIRKEHSQGGMASVGGMFWRYLEKVYKARIDRTNPIRKLVMQIARQAEANNQDLDLTAWKNPQMQAQKINSFDAAGYLDIVRGVHWENAAGHGSVNLRDALATAFGGTAYELWTDAQRDAFGAYLIARRGRWLWQRFDMDPTRNRGRLANAPQNPQSGDWYYDTMQRRRRVFLGNRWEDELTHAPDKHTRADHDMTVAELQQANPQFAPAANMVYAFLRDLALKRYQAGLDTRDEYDHKIASPDYVPWFRDMTDQLFAGTALSGRKVAAKFKLKGSYRDFINPIEGIARQVFDTNFEIAVNKPKLLLAKMAEAVQGAGRYAEIIPATRMRVEEVRIRDALENAGREQGLPPQDVKQMVSAVAAMIGDDAVGKLFKSDKETEGTDAILHYMDGGELKMLQIHDDGHGIARDIIGFFEVVRGTPIADGLTNMLVGLVRIPQKGITSTLAFFYRNIIRDMQQATVLQAGYFPVISNIRTIASNRARRARGDETWSEILARHGGIMGGIGRTDVAMMRQGRVSELRTLGVTLEPWRRDFWARTVNPWHDDFWKWAEWSESNSRQTLARIAFNRTFADAQNRYPTMPVEQQTFVALEAAVQRSRDYTDYGRMGDAPSQAMINKLIMFLNPALQGPDKAIRTLFLAQTNEGRFAAAQLVRKKLLPLVSSQYQSRPLTESETAALKDSARAWLTVLMIAFAHLAIEMAFNDPDELEDRSELERAMYVTFTINGETYKIPRGFDAINLVSNGVRANYESWFREDPTAKERFRRSLLLLTPPMSSPLLDLYIGWKHNRNNFFNTDVEPEYMQGLMPTERYSAYTSNLAREISKGISPIIDVSPIMVEYSMNAIGSDWSRDILRAYDAFDPDKPALKWQEFPFLRAARGSKVSRGSNEYWELMGSDGDFQQPAGSYKQEAVDRRNWRQEDIRRFFEERVTDDDAKAFAILNAHYEKDQRRLHPMERARDMVSAASATMREIADNRIDVPVTRKKVERADVSRAVRGYAMEILAEVNRREYRNALIALQRPGYENREPQPVEPYLDELKTISPEIWASLRKKMVDSDGRPRVYNYDEVRKFWPEMKRRLLSRDKREEIIEKEGQVEFKDFRGDVGIARSNGIR
jgi:hypothetical protein